MCDNSNFVDNTTQKVFRDLHRFYNIIDGEADYLPGGSYDDVNLKCSKLKCELKNGKRIYWYYQDDIDFAQRWNEDVKLKPPYSGILILTSDTDTQFAPDMDQCIIVCDEYPTEKCSPVVFWVALNRLIDDENLIEIFSRGNYNERIKLLYQER